jgi:xanthine dehydrogenase accessory factor
MVLEDSRAALDTDEPRIREYQLRERGEGAVGMVCGGRATVLIEIVRGPDRLMIFGAGHVGQALAEKAAGLDLDLIVIDDRPEYLHADRFPAGTGLVCAGPGFEAELPEPDPGTYVCILTRCHRTDLEVLRRLAGKPAAYIGVIGSRRKGLRILSALRSENLAPEYIETIRTPIGIEIGGRTPAEIAVSILAEVILERNRAAPRERRTRRMPAASET